MIAQKGTAIDFYAFYTKFGLGVTGLTVTVDVYRNGTEILSAQATTEKGDGLYYYQMASGSNTAAGVYIAIFKTAGDVDTPHLAHGWAVNTTNLMVTGAVEYTYTVNDGVDPIEGAEVWISTDSGGANIIWYGVSDASGIARASDDEKPWLDTGTYYAWAQKGGYTFSNPDTLTVTTP